jgi:hypothetical protein
MCWFATVCARIGSWPRSPSSFRRLRADAMALVVTDMIEKLRELNAVSPIVVLGGWLTRGRGMRRVMAAALGASFFLFGSVWALAQDQFRPIGPAQHMAFEAGVYAAWVEDCSENIALHRERMLRGR